MAANGMDRAGRRPEICQMLIAARADTAAVDNKEGTALHRAAGTGALETCRTLLELRCFDVNQAANC